MTKIKDLYSKHFTFNGCASVQLSFFGGKYRPLNKGHQAVTGNTMYSFIEIEKHSEIR